ncbi:MAG: bifunctional nuclease family protein [Brooklawnia sp.]|jgi:bifunctional DNase/RNase
MIQVEFNSLAVDTRGLPVVLLRPKDPHDDPVHVLPIWIGMQEASAIVVAAQGAVTARPMAYDLMVRLLDALQGSVVQVAVTRLEEGTFYAEITLDTPFGRQVIDARPSDSVALALRVEAPIFVAEAVLREAGIPAELITEQDEESQIEEFNEFLDSVDPDDFRG